MKQSLANVFGALGYISLLLQWVWTALVIGTPIVASDFFKNAFLPKESSVPAEALSMNVPEPIGIIFMFLAIIFAIGVTIYAVLAVPRNIARTGQRLTRSSAQVIIPHVTHHKHISEKRRKTLLERITWSIKIGLTILPAAALGFRPDEMIGLSHGVIIGVGLFCAVATVLWFGLQFIVAKVAKLDSRQIW